MISKEELKRVNELNKTIENIELLLKSVNYEGMHFLGLDMYCNELIDRELIKKFIDGLSESLTTKKSEIQGTVDLLIGSTCQDDAAEKSRSAFDILELINGSGKLENEKRHYRTKLFNLHDITEGK